MISIYLGQKEEEMKQKFELHQSRFFANWSTLNGALFACVQRCVKLHLSMVWDLGKSPKALKL